MAEDKKAKTNDKPKDDKLKEEKLKDIKGGKESETVEGEEGGAEADAPRRFTPKKILLFIVLPLVVLIGGSAAAYFTGALDKVFPPKELSCENVKEGDEDYAACSVQREEKDAATPGSFLDIPDIIVNLNSTTKQPRFLKISIKIEMENEIEQKKLEPLLPRVKDQFQMYLRELRIEDLRGTSGIYRMKIELLSRVRAAAPSVKVRDVLFQEILVQ